MHRKDSHWFLPTESPANTTLPFLPLFRISLALNLSRNRRSKLRKISIQAGAELELFIMRDQN
jgi:hypothetical protein